MARSSRRKNTTKSETVEKENTTVNENISETSKPVEEEADKKESVETKEETSKPVKEEADKKEENKESERKIDLTKLDVNNTKYIDTVLKEAKTLDELLEKLSKSELVKTDIARLQRYVNIMRNKHSENDGVGRQYDLYNLILEIAKQPDYSKFNIRFKVLNKAFLLGRNDVFHPINLSRYDYLWRWGMQSYKAYFKLVELISELANPGVRNKKNKSIDFKNGLKGLPDQAIQNLSRFYGVTGK